MNNRHKTYNKLEKQEALKSIVQQLVGADEIPSSVSKLVQAYKIQIDELTESGLPYETACALEKILAEKKLKAYQGDKAS